MEAKEVLLALRTKRGFSQKELAERLFVPARRCLDGRWGDPSRAGKPSAPFRPV